MIAATRGTGRPATGECVRSDPAPSGARRDRPSGRSRATSGRARGYPRSSSTASGVCSRTMNRSACGGRRSRVSAADHDHRRERAGGRSTPPAGRAARRPSRSVVAVEIVHTTAAPEPRPPTEQPGDRAGGGEPAPPDPEQQQRAERRGGDRERQPDRPRDAHVGCDQRDQAAAPARRRPPPSRNAVTPPSRRPPQRRPITSWLSTPATAIDSPELVERNAANAPAVDEAGQQLAEQPVDHQPRQLEHQRVAAAVGGQLGCVDPAERAVHRRQQVEEAEQRRARRASSGGRRGRRGWCRSGPRRAAAPSCRGTSRGSASR